MAAMSFGNKAGKVQRRTSQAPGPAKSPDEVLRELKEAQLKPAGEDYRERSLALHGQVCARCGRDFEGKNRQLLTVHHRDGNHDNNPPDGSNWENLCVYCHDDAHGRGELGQYAGGARYRDDRRVVYEDPAGAAGGGLGALLQKALEKKRR
ncbi:MAG: YajD family HNH nuclease [Deferrisomatales bacterium]